MTDITFNELPKAVQKLSEEIRELKTMINSTKQSANNPTKEELLTIKEASILLHLTVPTLYSKHSKGEIPGVFKCGKRLYFSKQILIEWIQKGRIQSKAELITEVENNLSNTKKAES